MTIEFPCTSCTSTLRVDDEHSGKKARCPKCGMIQDVPGSTLHPALRETVARGQEQWLLRTPDGETYGPVARTELDQWSAEGRISPQCLVQLDGDSRWESAVTLYPNLATAAPIPVASVHSSNEPYSVPYSSPVAGRRGRANNGVTILVFGILAVFFLWFPILALVFAIIAWSMGASDLAAIRRGEMDPTGRGMVQAGYIMGIVCTVLGALCMVSCCGLVAVNP